MNTEPRDRMSPQAATWTRCTGLQSLPTHHPDPDIESLTAQTLADYDRREALLLRALATGDVS